MDWKLGRLRRPLAIIAVLMALAVVTTGVLAQEGRWRWIAKKADGSDVHADVFSARKDGSVVTLWLRHGSKDGETLLIETQINCASRKHRALGMTSRSGKQDGGASFEEPSPWYSIPPESIVESAMYEFCTPSPAGL